VSAVEHYREAERLIELAESVDWQDGDPARPSRAEYAQTVLASAQVHATLAQVGATLVAATTNLFPGAALSDVENDLYIAAVQGGVTAW